MKELTFRYLGEDYNLFEIVSEKNFLSTDDEDNDLGINIILKHGIKELSDHFGFKEYDSKILAFQDTVSWGTMMVMQVTMIRTPKEEINQDGEIKSTEPIEDRLFIGDGEVNAKNFTSETVCFPEAVCRKRAVSRAVLWELGIPAFGEEESEGFHDTVKRRKKNKSKFSSSKSAQPSPESAPTKQYKSKPSANGADVRDRLKKLKALASEKKIDRQALVGKIKVAFKNVGHEIKGMPETSDFEACPEALDETERIIMEVSS